VSAYPLAVQSLIDTLGRLPGIGPKSAQRIAFHLLLAPPEEAERLALTVRDARSKVRFCTRCFHLADDELCEVCRDDRRDPHVVCVVEEPRDVIAVEKTGEFRGRYHVLQGLISPIDGVSPDRLRIRELVGRIAQERIREVIVATSPTTEGDVTAYYLAKLLEPLEVTVTRLASGLPVGGELEYADELTLGRALAGRRQLHA
jgi:recombination protein RecR